MQYRRMDLVLGCALVAGACGAADTEPLATAATDAHVAHVRSDDNPAISTWIAQLRQATVAFRDFDAAQQAGYSVPVLACMELPGTGGMGFHFAGATPADDAQLDPLAPELLVYEPQQNGRLRLVAVEYLIPFTAWPYDPDNRPELNGIPLHDNQGLGVWVLHAWVWKNNPAGMFENWNPDVTCEHAGLFEF